MSPLEIRGSQKNTSTLVPDTTVTDTSVGARGIWFQIDIGVASVKITNLNSEVECGRGRREAFRQGGARARDRRYAEQDGRSLFSERGIQSTNMSTCCCCSGSHHRSTPWLQHTHRSG